MLPCNEVVRLHASDDRWRASWKTRLAVRIHRMMCRSCSRYVRELTIIGQAVRNTMKPAADEPERHEALAQRVLASADLPPE